MMRIISIFCTLLLTVLASAATAQEKYPTLSITLIVPYSAGGSTDVSARIWANFIEPCMGKKIIVANKPGASGLIGLQEIINSKPDGYTLEAVSVGSNVVAPAISPNLPFKWNNVTPIAHMQLNPQMLVVRDDSKFKTLLDLLEFARAHPKELRYGTSGLGTLDKFNVLLLMKQAKIDPHSVVDVPFTSARESALALLGGKVDFVHGTVSGYRAFLESHKLRAFAVATNERIKQFPDIPTYKELGYPQVNLNSWKGIVGPPGLPKYVVDKWNKCLKEILHDKKWREAAEKEADMIEYKDAEEFRKLMEREFEVFRQLGTEFDILIK